MSIEHPYASGELDREIVLSRVINSPRDLVYRAWIEPERMFAWFGPTGFRCEVLEQGAASVGATWRFNMVAPEARYSPIACDFWRSFLANGWSMITALT